MGVIMETKEFEVVARTPRTLVEKETDLLNAIMTTAWETDTCVRVRALPWTMQGLRAILSRRGYRLRTAHVYHGGGTESLHVWCEIIMPQRPPKPKHVALTKRRIRL